MSASNALDGYQEMAARTVNPALDDAQRLLDAAAGLAEEAGEVLGHVRKHVMQGRALDRDAVVKELGDALWCLAIA
ncbi:MAG: MazG nucleotide pyrophosphohydrolase domain-containing protein, partial [Gemmatimonadaceae bacterium]